MVEASTGDLGAESRKRQIARWAMEDFPEEVTFKLVRASQKERPAQQHCRSCALHAEQEMRELQGAAGEGTPE